MSSCGVGDAKRRRLNTNELAEFCIGPKRNKFKYLYKFVDKDEKGDAIFMSTSQGKVTWIFKASDWYQANQGDIFEKSIPRWRTWDNPVVPGPHDWEQFSTKTKAWTPCDFFETSYPVTSASTGRTPQTHEVTQDSKWLSHRPEDFHSSTTCTKVVSVDDLRYSQESIGRSFSDGKTFEELISGLSSWRIDPLTADFLCLQGFETKHGIHSAENRRLFCLKEHQRLVRP